MTSEAQEKLDSAGIRDGFVAVHDLDSLVKYANAIAVLNGHGFIRAQLSGEGYGL
jgi:hypothetical protein